MKRKKEMIRKRKCSFGTGRVIGYVVECRAESMLGTINSHQLITDANVLVSVCGKLRAANDRMFSKKVIDDAIQQKGRLEINGEHWVPVKITHVLTSTPYDPDAPLDGGTVPEFIVKSHVGSLKLVKMSTKANGGACDQFYEYMRFLEEASKGISGNIALHEHGVMLISTGGKLSAKVKCDLSSVWKTKGVSLDVGCALRQGSGSKNALSDFPRVVLQEDSAD